MMRPNRLFLLAVPTLLFFGCSDDTTLFTPCATSADCATGNSCMAGFCTPTDGRGGRDVGATSDTSNPGIDVGSGGDDVSTLDVPVSEDPGECVPNCSGLECGEDGCGGSCGSCSGTESCVSGVCQSGGSGSGDDSCQDIVACVSASDGTEEAFNACIAAGTPAAQSEAVEVYTCVSTNCNDPDLSQDQFEACVSASCSSEIADCGGGLAGAGTCGGIIECINASDASQAAFDACVAEGTSDAQGLLREVLTCIDINCSEPGMTDDEFGECQAAFCQSQLNACFGV